MNEHVTLPTMVTNSTDTITNSVSSLIGNLHATETYFLIDIKYPVYRRQASMLFDWSVNHKTLRTWRLYGAAMHERERERETEIYEWVDEGWVSDLDTTGIFFCIRPQDILNTDSDLLSAKKER